MISLVIALLALATLLTIAYGTTRSWPHHDRTPPVTVVVCARDEEATLFDCLMALATQDYPHDHYRLILVDHLSQDATGEIMETFAENAPVPTRVIHISEEDPQLAGKVHALAVGLEHVETELVLLTDGDCIVPDSWIRAMVSYFEEDVVAVAGLVSVGLDGIPEDWIGRLQNVDHRYYLGMLTGLSGLRAPSGRRKRDRIPQPFRSLISRLRPAFCSGNNLGFRMSAYREVGGYRAIGNTFIEDYALLNRIVSRTRKHLAVVPDSAVRVFTTAQPDLRGLWRQKRRWATGTSIFNPLSAYLFIEVGMIRILLPWLVLFQPLPALAALALVAAADTIVIRNVSRLTGHRIYLRDILFHEIYQIALNHMLLLATITHWPVVWKGQKYR
ncbi:MAG TPA: glycosyltransferase [Bacteroidetes bacterium]|nr:glycosyltransferase [Bacteroidota bacterium]